MKLRSCQSSARDRKDCRFLVAAGILETQKANQQCTPAPTSPGNRRSIKSSSTSKQKDLHEDATSKQKDLYDDSDSQTREVSPTPKGKKSLPDKSAHLESLAQGVGTLGQVGTTHSSLKPYATQAWVRPRASELKLFSRWQTAPLKKQRDTRLRLRSSPTLPRH